MPRRKPGDMKRRTFLQTGAALGAGFWVSGGTSIAQSSSPNEKLNIACIGAGGKGESNILGVMRENIVAVAEVDDVRGAKGLKSIPRAKRYYDFREMLDKEKNLDAVVVSTPDHTHGPAAIAAMKRGCHVYCEKPLAHSIHETRVMKTLAVEKKLATQMGNQGHSGPVLREAVEVVRSGAIGKVTQFHAWTNRPSSWPQGLQRPTSEEAIPDTFKWDLWLGPAAERPYSSMYAPFKWRGWWDFGTGALGDMACHILDMGFWALELGYPTSVEADAVGMTDVSGPTQSTIRYKFPARGSNPPVELTWYDGGRKPDPSLIGEKELAGGGSILIGDKGMMYVPSDYASKYVLLPRDKFADYKPPARTLPRAGLVANEILAAAAHYTEWLNACKGGPPSLSNFEYAAFLTEVVLLGNLAVRSGKTIEWDPVAMKAKGVPEADVWIKPEARPGWEI